MDVQKPAIAGRRANTCRYHLRHLVITGQVAPSEGALPNTVGTSQASHTYLSARRTLTCKNRRIKIKIVDIQNGKHCIGQC